VSHNKLPCFTFASFYRPV